MSEHAHRLKKMSQGRMERHLESLLAELSNIAEEEMTTFELNFLKSFSENPPHRARGVEEKLV